MMYKLKFWLYVFCSMFCMNVVYGNEINKIDDLLADYISLEDKLEYLDSIKKDYSFSIEDIEIIKTVLDISLSEIDNNEEIETYKYYDDNNDNEIRIKMVCSILEIFLKEDIDEDILTQSLLSEFTGSILSILDGLKEKEDKISSKLRFLSLRVLVKINRLKSNEDDSFIKSLREESIRFFTEQEGLLEDTELLVKENERYYRNKWQIRTLVENYIFEPLLLQDETDSIYVNENKKVLYEYEKYLLDNLQYFCINENLKRLVEEAFWKSNYKEFKYEYINIMFCLDMRDALLRIIKDKIIDSLRQKAIETSIKLLDQVELLYYKRFSRSLLEALENISSDSEESEVLRKVAEQNIKFVKLSIDKHKDVEYDFSKNMREMILDPFKSTQEKIEYLNIIVTEGFTFSMDDLLFAKEIFSRDDINQRLKAKLALIVLWKGKYNDVVAVFTAEELETLKFLQMNDMLMLTDATTPDWMVNYSDTDSYIEVSEVPDDIDDDTDTADSTENEEDKTNNYEGKTSVAKASPVEELSNYLEQYVKLDRWNDILENISSKIFPKDHRKQAIKTALYLLTKTKDFDKFSTAFVEVLRVIANDVNESHDLRNIADFILLKVNNKGVEILKQIDCAIYFMF